MTMPYDPQASAPDMTDPGIAVIQQTMQQSFPTHENAAVSEANTIVAPEPQDWLATIAQHEQHILLAHALYGSDFPATNPAHTLDDWASWIRGRWDAHRAAVEKHLHLVERNRLFRAGQQWVSSRGVGGNWREPLKPVDSTRAVYNMIDKALDQRLQVANDQRPGFKVEPTSYGPDEKKKAEARQLALEYQ